MNVFEDLILELKEENLLESTVIDVGAAHEDDTSYLHDTEVPNTRYDLPEYGDEDDSSPTDTVEPSAYGEVLPTSGMHNPQNVDDPNIHETVAAPVAHDLKLGKTTKKGKEFFNKRAMGEVSSLQMVEHVVTGVEREYMKVVPKTFDDFNAKRALHSFLHLDEGFNTEEHAAAEFTLMQETEGWCSALADRDSHVPVSSLRQYCENSRPALSSQALLGLARFYRNLPYSESVRSKFDFVITRLFSRPVEQEMRVCLFNRDEMLGHINMLYSEWSSISLYAADDDESKVLLTALSFEDLSIEAENASTFDQLIESDFFGRLRMFKESISELFFAPNVTAAAIECNIRIGNAYVALIDRERQKLNAAAIQSKYGTLNDQAVSEATGRTLELVDLLRELSEATESNVHLPDPVAGNNEVMSPPTVSPTVRPESQSKVKTRDPEKVLEEQEKDSLPWVERLKENARNVNKWFLAGCLTLIGLSIGIYVYSSFLVVDTPSTSSVTKVDLENSILKEHIKVGRISGDTFYGLMLPSWDALPKDKRQEFLQKVLQAGSEKGYKQVNLIGKDGKLAAYASATRFEVMP